jgi:uncharacterized protein (TIGR02145 family)
MNSTVRAGSACPIAKLALTATLALATTLTLIACDEKKKQDGADTKPPEAEAAAEKPAENAGGGDTQGGCPNAVTGNGTLTCGGQTYKTVKIGEQVWMAENLNFEAKDSKCYDNKPDNCNKYGRLYYWNTATEVCPNGWHLPSPEDWNKLLSYVDGTSGTDPYESKTVGKYLKAKSWENNDNGTDKFGFSALPGGNGDESGGFALIGSNGFWWSNTSDEFYLFMTDIDDIVRTSNINGEDEGDFRRLLSVRCIKD